MNVALITTILFVLVMCMGCATRKPGDKPSNLDTVQYAKDDVVYYGFGFTF